MLKRLSKWAVRSIGGDINLLRNSQGEVLGIELLRRSKEQPLRGMLTEVRVANSTLLFFVDNLNDSIQREFVNGKIYEQEEIDLISQHFRGGTFVDVGSNVGNHSVFFAKLGGAQRVVAVEPNPRAYRLLRYNLLLNGVSDRVVHLPVAFSDKSGTACIDAPTYNLGGGRLTEDGGDAAVCKLVTGDSLLETEDVRFIKIDTEGHEMRVLRGLRQTLVSKRPAVFVEVDHSNDEAFRHFLGDVGYEVVTSLSRYQESRNYLAKSPYRPECHSGRI